MKLIMIMSNMLNLMFINTKQPMNLIIIILTQTVLSTFMMSTSNKLTWFNYILMIIFIGGMMVLFIYITSITPNEKNFSYIKLIPIILTISMIILYQKSNPFISTETTMNHFTKINNNQINLNMMFNYPTYSLSIMMMIYMFIALIVINKISNLEKGPLRMNN